MTIYETWLAVVGYEGFYEVSDLGRVRSLDRTVAVVTPQYEYARDLKGAMLTLFKTHEIPSYFAVSLFREGRGRTLHVHQLVLASFVGPMPEGLQVRHLNGNSLDNRVSNLAYGTPSENQLDNVRLGTHANARKTHCPHGHEYTPENTRRDALGGRYCRACNLRAAQKYRQRRRARDREVL